MAGVAQAGLTDIDRALVERARARTGAGAVGDLCYDMTSIASPTGEELNLAEYLADRLARVGARTRISRLGESGASFVARIGRAQPDGVRLWIYAPLDTAFSGNVNEDEPWLGNSPRADFALPASREGGKIIGMGAENPKGFASAGIAAFEAIALEHPDLRGEIVLTLAGGSMPVGARPGLGSGIGHGAGMKQLIAEEPRADFAIVLKPGYAVSHEEVGYAWFRVTVRGAVNYTGIRHKGPYRNPVVAAARVVNHLEGWFPEYTVENSSGSVAPQGSINAVSGGSADRASFIPQSTELEVDLRIAPDSSIDAAQSQLHKALERLKEAEPDLDFAVEFIAGMPGTRTDPESWIVRTLISSYERFESKSHEVLKRTSGASDAALIREAGVQTARIGLPPPATPSPFSGFSMGVADEESMARLARFLIEPAVETASKSRAEVGLR